MSPRITRPVNLDRRHLATLRKRHNAYIVRARARGARILRYKPPCGCKPIETPVPANRAEKWDTCATCPQCGALHFKISYFSHVVARALPQ